MPAYLVLTFSATPIDARRRKRDNGDIDAGFVHVLDAQIVVEHALPWRMKGRAVLGDRDLPRRDLDG